MKINFLKQRSLGIAGLALLRNLLIGEDSVAKSIFTEISNITNDLNDGVKLKASNITKYGVNKGYDVWAETYDSMPNLLINIEEPKVKSIIKALPKGKVLDAGCGTGRYWNFLNSYGYSVIGVDQSKLMLEKAKAKLNKVKLIRANLTNLPIKPKSIDIVLCSLALTHFKSLDKVIPELYKTLRPGGYMVLSDIHPVLVSIGAHADFKDKFGKTGYIINFTHWPSSYIKQFNLLGLKIIQCLEPSMESKEIKLMQSGLSLNNKTVVTAFNKLPVSLIWLLRRPKSQLK